MAHILTWKDLTETQLVKILERGSSAANTRRRLQVMMELDDDLNPVAEILGDLHFGSLMFAQQLGLDLEKTSTLISIIKSIHEQSIADRLTVERSWEKAKDLLLMHTVQRPPFSIGLFTLKELQEMTSYLLNTYYRHYRLYQYAFTSTTLLNLITKQPDVELPFMVPSLNLAITQAEYDYEQKLLEKKKKEEASKKAEEDAIAEELARQAAIEAAYRAAIPDEVTRKVNEAVGRHVGQMKLDLEKQISGQEQRVVEKINKSKK